jgi:hypothetical protein
LWIQVLARLQLSITPKGKSTLNPRQPCYQTASAGERAAYKTPDGIVAFVASETPGDTIVVLMADQPDAVTINFRLNNSDVFRAIAGQLLRKFWILLLFPIVGTISIIWALIDPNNGAASLNSGCIMLAIGAFFFGLAPYLQTRTVMKAPNFGGLMTLTVSEKGIELTAEHSNARIDWTIVKEVSETSHAILLYLKPAGFKSFPSVNSLRQMWRRSRIFSGFMRPAR